MTLIYEEREGKSFSSFTFTKNGQAKVQICLNTKTPETVETIGQFGFKILEETQGNGLVGQISIENIEKLAAVEEIRFVVPEPQYEPNN